MEEESKEQAKNGMSVDQIQQQVRKYGLEVALCIIFILTAVFTLIWSAGVAVWSILLAMIFAIIGVLLPKPIDKISKSANRFIYKDTITSILFSIIFFILAIFIPPAIFALIGILAGKSLAVDGQMGTCCNNKSENCCSVSDKDKNIDPDSDSDSDSE